MNTQLNFSRISAGMKRWVLCALLLVAHLPVSAVNRVTTLAGSYGNAGSTGDGGPAAAARFDTPTGVLVDANANILVADTGNARVRSIAPDGTITTIAGTGVAGYSGDGGLPTAAQLRSPQALAVDAAGNLYIADKTDHRIRRITLATGFITTYAGNGTAGSGGNGGQATAANLNEPVAMVFDATGNLFIAERAGHRIRRVAPDGVITTAVGDGVPGFTGDNGLATNARLNAPEGITIDASGSLHIADTGNHRIRRITGFAMIETVVGSGAASYGGDGGAPILAGIPQPTAIRFDASGMLYIATSGDRRIRVVTTNAIIHTFAGNGSTNPVIDGQNVRTGEMPVTGPIAFDAAHRLYVTQGGAHVLRRIDPPLSGDVVSRQEFIAATDGFKGRVASPYDSEFLAGNNIAIGPSRRSYVIGSERRSFGNDQFGYPIRNGDFIWRIVRNDPVDGRVLNNHVWTQQWDSGNGRSEPYAIALDHQENPVVVGIGRRSNGTLDWRVHKYAHANGNVVWAQGDATTPAGAFPYLVGIDGANHAIVVGIVYANGSQDWLIRRYAPNGSLSWEKQISGAGTGDEAPYAMAIDPATNDVIVAGTLIGTQSVDFTTVRLASSTGQVSWQQAFSQPGFNIAVAVAIDPAGSIYIAGEQIFDGQQARPRVEKRRPDGTLLWAHVGTFERAGIFAMALGSEGDPYVGGYRYLPSLFTPDGNTYLRSAPMQMRLDRTSGNVLWIRDDFSGTGHSYVRDIKVGFDGHPVSLTRQMRGTTQFPTGHAPNVSWFVHKRSPSSGLSNWSWQEMPNTPGVINDTHYVPAQLLIDIDTVLVSGTKREEEYDQGLYPDFVRVTRHDSPLLQEIQFGAIGNRPYATTTFTVAPLGGRSGYPVKVQSMTPTICTTTGANGTLIGSLAAGLCTLRATQAGDLSWQPATPVDRSFTITPGVQNLTFPTPSPKTFGGPAFVLLATGGQSGNPVVFTSLTSTICGTTGNTAMAFAAGTCTIRASQAGNAQYAPATDVERSFPILPAAQMITFPALGGRTYGDPPFQISATGGASGNPVTFASTTTAICTTSGTVGNTVTIVGTGLCSVRATQAGNTQYSDAPPISQAFQVAPGNQAITFGALPDRTYGDPPTTMTATGGTSGNPVTFGSITQSKCTASGVNGEILTIQSAGTCTIVASQEGNLNFHPATDVSRSFTIAKATQSITFDTQTMPSRMFEANAVFEVAPLAIATSGLLIAYTSNDTNVCSVAGGSTIQMHAAGVCGLVANQNGTVNYLPAQPVTQNVVITRATQTIHLNAPSMLVYTTHGSFGASGGASGNPVVVTSLTPQHCSISGVLIHTVLPGTCTLRAEQAGNTNYLDATPLTVDITIVRAEQAIEFAPLPASIGRNASVVVSAIGGASDQPVVFTSHTPAICSSTGPLGATITGLDTGLCVIAANQGGNAYFHPANEATVSLPVGLQTITFESPTLFLGEPRVVPVRGGLSGQPVVLVSTTPAICTTVGTHGHTVTRLTNGACSLTATQASGPGYDAAPSVQVTSYPPRVDTLAASAVHAAAIRSDGTLWTVGSNISGQLGDDSVTARSTWQPVPGSHYRSVTVGDLHTAAFRSDGTLWRMPTASGLLPAQDMTASNWIEIAAGANTLAGLRADGTVLVWDDFSAPPRAIDGGPWMSVAANMHEFLLVHASGHLWHLPWFAQAPDIVPAAGNWRQVRAQSMNLAGTDPTRFALAHNGALWGWGNNQCGQIGTASTEFFQTPVPVGTMTNWLDVQAGFDHTIARRDNGTLWTFGCNGQGQLGLGNTTGTLVPIQVGTRSDWVDIAAGRSFSIAQRADGTLWSFGENADGALGNGTIATFTEPTQALQAPQIGSATGGPGSATVTFTPLGATFNPVTDYRAISTPGGFSASCTAPCNAIIVHGLTAGASYTFTVAATNAAGQGLDSEPSNAITPSVPPTYTVTPSVDGPGALSPATMQTVVAGTRVVFTMSMGPQYRVAVDSSCGGVLDQGVTFTTGPVHADCTVLARFTLKTYQVTASASAFGTISPAATQTIAHGDTAEFSVMPDAGYVAVMGGGCGGTLTDNVFETEPVTANCNVTATFVTTPGAPTLKSILPLDAAARIVVQVPSTDGGSPILDYLATCTPGGIQTVINATTIDVFGLMNQVAYRCSVRARNAAGLGPASSEGAVIPGSAGNVADLVITKTNGTNFINGAVPTDYVITVINLGPAAVIGARVEDAIGAGTDFSDATWTCSAIGGAACPVTNQGVDALDARIDLPAESSVMFVLSAMPNVGAETPVSNMATVTPPGSITDPDLDNNIATDGPDRRGIFRNGFE